MLKDFPVTTFVEIRTGGGQILNCQCRPEDVKIVEELMPLLYSVNIRSNQPSIIQHGNCDDPSRYKVFQYKYAGSNGEYAEVLLITNPPKNRHPFIIYEKYHHDSWFSEWDSLEQAIDAFENYLERGLNNKELLSEHPGFKRLIQCSGLTPWFYAIGTEELIGDYAFPYGIEEDSVFRFGRKFLVPRNKDNESMIKTCMGTRFIKEKERRPYRIIYWNDGTSSNENSSIFKSIQPLEDDKLWIHQAIQKFTLFLNGNIEKISINFIDGYRLKCELQKPEELITKEGSYTVKVYLQGQVSPITCSKDFKPSEKYKDLLSMITDEFKKADKYVEKIKIVRQKTLKTAKKWSGVFFNRF